MATVHATTMAPTKLELLTGWLPRQPWYRGTGTPELSRAGGFRLDDPAGEVGIELMLVTDGSGAEARTYFVPVTYRGAALDEAADGLVGTSEHGVLGTRWIYDAEHDPVATAQLLAFVAGAVEAQHQSRSDTRDPTVGRSWSGDGEPRTVKLVRVPEPGQPGTATGAVEVDWTRPDGSAARGVVAVVR
ncbi:maltokinase N-terminal cap-like domain-containing protein [Blastococcus brunescens]|uniref:1,4-alpha-glucan branching protein n=1 Tax=Blastococcus brunescens TaxID=1564165 RepID=A0ABZ1ATX4_9ACTN|nr:1,4-alpha-glucan branching protein [Blastococcus sp. BMG 8361]WRL61955.1 1,4-alpha-glucan branching protein [Blastococcus sp. BMG 8361]